MSEKNTATDEMKMQGEKLDKLISSVKEINERNDKLEKKINPLDVDALKKAKDDAIKLHEEFQGEKQKVAAQEKVIEEHKKHIEALTKEIGKGAGAKPYRIVQKNVNGVIENVLVKNEFACANT